MLQRNSSILWRELAGEAVLLNPAEGCSFNLNAVGTVIWKLLDGNHSPEAIAQVVYEQYEVEPEQALEDVRHLLAEFQANPLLGMLPLAYSKRSLLPSKLQLSSHC